MADVNYLEYGSNALRIGDSAKDTAVFLGQNGELIGVLLVVAILVFGIFLLIALVYFLIVRPFLRL